MSEHGEKSIANIMDNGYVRLTTVIGGFIFAIGVAIQATGFVTTMTFQLSKIEEEVVTLHQTIDENTEDRWKKSDMIRLCREIELSNDGFSCGTID